MDTSAIQAEMDAAEEAFRAKFAEFERLVDDHVLLRIHYIQAMNIRSKWIWKSCLDVNRVSWSRDQGVATARRA
jgi:hypothetical protein